MDESVKGTLNDASKYLDVLKSTVAKLSDCIGKLECEISSRDETIEELFDYIEKLEKSNAGDSSESAFNLPRYLTDDFTSKKAKPGAFILDGKEYETDNWQNLLVMVCEILYNRNQKLFKSFVGDKTMQGTRAAYFAYIPDSLSRGVLIPGSKIYVETNRNANYICRMIIKMLGRYEIPVQSFQIIVKKSIVDEIKSGYNNV